MLYKKLLMLTLMVMSFNVSAEQWIDNRIETWSSLTANQYMNRLIECQLDIREFKWSQQIWPEENILPKPVFNRTAHRQSVKDEVILNLNKAAILKEQFNFEIKPQMLQSDIDRMVRNSKNPRGLKQLFKVLNNDGQTVAECLSRWHLIDKKLKQYYTWNSQIHSAARALASEELKQYHDNKVQPFSAESHHKTFYLKTDQQQSATDDLSYLSLEMYEKKLKYYQDKQLKETNSSFYWTELSHLAPASFEVKFLVWDKLSLSEWLSEQNPISQSFVPAKAHYNIPKTFIDSEPSQEANSWRALPFKPAARKEHAAVWTGSEMIVWGGMDNHTNQWLNSGGRYDPVTDTWVEMSRDFAPIAASDFSLIWTGSKVIVWVALQGNDHTGSGGMYDPATNTWSAVSNIGAPRSEYGHTVVWTGTHMIVWGGGNVFGQGGKYHPESDTWTTIKDGNDPSMRVGHAAVWTGTHMVIWGGDGTYKDTGKMYDPIADDWTVISDINAPKPTRESLVVWTGTEVIIWGGYEVKDSAQLSGRYNPSSNTWSNISALNAPSARNDYSAVWNGEEVIIWGGRVDQTSVNDGYSYHPASDSWQYLAPIAGAPTPRDNHSAIWTGDHMIIWGGVIVGTAESDNGGIYDPIVQSWLDSSLNAHPFQGDSFAAVWTGGELLVWGGSYYDENYYNGGFVYNLMTDTWTSTSMHAAPHGRVGHTGIWTGSEVIVWGGDDGSSYLNSGGVYNPVSKTWSETIQFGAPSPREAHTAVWTGTEMIVWGGRDETSPLNTGGRYNPMIDVWHVINETDAPEARVGHSAVMADDLMLVWGGKNMFGEALGSGNIYNPESGNWSPVAEEAVPQARQNHSAVWSGHEMVIWGGDKLSSPGSYFITGGLYNMLKDAWTKTSISGAPTGRINNTTVWTGEDMIVWGGQDIVGDSNTGGIYRPSIDEWSLTSVNGAPAARSFHSAVWTGQEMLVFGGRPAHEMGIYVPYNLFSIGGSVYGLNGAQITLQNNGGNDLNLNQDGFFQFSKPVKEGESYNVTVSLNSTSPDQNCFVIRGNGSEVSENVTDVIVYCDRIFENGFE